jgi:signal transduction histidine kinase
VQRHTFLPHVAGAVVLLVIVALAVAVQRRDPASRLPEAMLVMGMLIAITIAGMMQMYQTAERRAHALARANRLLEAEIRERERAQDALERSEEQLRHSQKMEAVGRLAGGVAHDFNNLLTAILGYSDFLLADIERNDPRRDDVREIKKAATRAGALTAQLLAFSRRQIRQPRPLDLNAILAGLDRMLRRVIGEDVHLEWQPSENLGTVVADPSEIEMMILNLVVNAGDAMPEGGTITVRTSHVVFDGRSHRQLGAGRYACLSVTDTGVGMDSSTRDRIFEPFFTTKDPGKGTGLGLSTVYAIVEHLHGAIDVESSVGAGTTFTVHLPLHDEPAETLATSAAPAVAPRGVETVMLVEDEDGVRALGSRILERHGYTVIEARNGREALKLAREHVGNIDLLLTDVVMPEMGGKQLATTLFDRDNDLRVLFMSGYTDGDISRRGELHPDTAFLQKPFTAPGLLSRVREVLDEVVPAA